ncbi:TonB-dependent receptor plug domain-containing protein [Sphingomonas panacisoli]|nr:TonB-dependent receptor plug domain-containing protein [Sphingomonas panacisoli]
MTRIIRHAGQIDGQQGAHLMNVTFSRSLRGSTALRALTLVGAGFAATVFANPAMAQDAAAAAPAPAAAPDAQDQAAPSSADIVVTGSISRNPAAATASPVVSVTAADLQNRGISTVADALQLLSANNAGTASPSWSSFGFATGASSPSLRGLNNAYSLVLFNGMRTAFYPLGDDGYRTFVDINTIPSSIVDRVDVLQDGASATYGSDAIAGVINVIVKREITGLHLNGSAAISQRSDDGERKLSATAGYGKLDEQGFNVYVNGEYQKSDPLFLRDRGFPFGTANQSSICGTAAQGCLFNGIRNGIQANGTYGGFAGTSVPFVRPYDATTLASLGSNQLLNPALGCQNLTPYTLTAAQRAGGGSDAAGNLIAPATVCQEDTVAEYRAYNSNITRKGLNARATFKLGSFGEAYVMANYFQYFDHG